MAKKSGRRIQQAIEKLRNQSRVKVRRPQALQQGRGRFQLLALQIVRNMIRESARGTIQQGPGVALDQQAQLGKFVLENRASGHKFVHELFPPGSLRSVVGELRYELSVRSFQFSAFGSWFS